MVMMNNDIEEYNPFWDGGAAALLLIAIAASMYILLCLPARHATDEMNKRLREAEERLEKKYDTLKAYRIKTDELRRGDPEAIDEAIREQLLKGEEDEYLL